MNPTANNSNGQSPCYPLLFLTYCSSRTFFQTKTKFNQSISTTGLNFGTAQKHQKARSSFIIISPGTEVADRDTINFRGARDNSAMQADVIYVLSRDARTLKIRLEKEGLLDKRFRMAPAPCFDQNQNGDVSCSWTNFRGSREGHYIAVPVMQQCIDDLQRENRSLGDGRPSEYCHSGCANTSWMALVSGFGRCYCPYSTTMLGNNSLRKKLMADEQGRHVSDRRDKLSIVHRTLVSTLLSLREGNDADTDIDKTKEIGNKISKAVTSSDTQCIPPKLEVMGDDRTLVIPRYALYMENINEESPTIRKKCIVEFRKLILQAVDVLELEEQGPVMETLQKVQGLLWMNLAEAYGSKRVVRRGDIHPESGVRESGHRILWPLPGPCSGSNKCQESLGDFNRGYLPRISGPSSPGWITVTEFGIKQSFDLTRVMFSRGNVTEKKRFGNLVQEDEVVLDMYSGIGYYTLPALVMGNARHVTSCEWNSHAVEYLKYNLKQNRVEDRARILAGDSRVSLRHLLDVQGNACVSDGVCDLRPTSFDRISLGLLPSSEGGWAVAMKCLNHTRGGWLHVHANVPTAERLSWTIWLVQSLARVAKDQEHSNDWVVVSHHVERVKSFAPKVDHVVADILAGPKERVEECIEMKTNKSEVLDSRKLLTQVDPPSCALDHDGILHQAWLRKCEGA